MGKLIKIALVAVFTVLSLYSCKDSQHNIVETNKFEPISNIVEDTVFANLLENNFRVANRIEDREAAGS